MDVWYNGDYGVSFYEYGTELEPFGRFLGHTWKNWGLIPTARPFVVPPTPKGSQENDSLYTNGNRNSYNDLLGFPLFNNREGSWTFYIATFNDYSEYIESDPNSADIYVRDSTAAQPPNMFPPMDDVLLSTTKQDFQTKYSQLLRMLNAKELTIVLDEDQKYFYRGNVQIEEFIASNDGSLNGFRIKYSLFPYKIEIAETTEVIKNSEQNRLGQTIPFSVGQMPVVPYLRIVRGTGTIQRYRVGFSNPEITGVSQTLPAYSEQYNVCISSGGKPNDIKYVKLYAQYLIPNGINRSTFLCSNFYGNNACSVMFDTNNTSSSHLESAELIFRKGWL